MEFRSVDTEDQALAVLAAHGADVRILAGGTDVMLQYQRGELTPRLLLHIGRIASFRGIQANGALHIGALATHDQLGRDPRVTRLFPALAEAARTVGGWQTQAAGTIGGNVCNASPAADTLPPLLTSDADVHLSSSTKTRTVRLEDFVIGRRAIARMGDEILTGLSLPAPPPLTGEVYLKVAPRGAMEVALVGLALRLTFGEDRQTISDARLAVCSVGPRPFRARLAERALVRGSNDALAEAGDLLAQAAEPIDDARATARYRRRILPALLRRAADICRERALSN